MEKFKNICNKIANVLQYIIGGSFMICLFVSVLGFIGYMIALVIGGQQAVEMCDWLKNVFFANLIKLSNLTVLVVFIYIYLKGDAKWINPFKYWKNKFSKKEE